MPTSRVHGAVTVAPPSASIANPEDRLGHRLDRAGIHPNAHVVAGAESLDRWLTVADEHLDGGDLDLARAATDAAVGCRSRSPSMLSVYSSTRSAGSPSPVTLPCVSQIGPVAHVLHAVQVVRHQHDGAALVAELDELLEASLLELTSPTARISSMISSRGSTLIATANARRTYMPDE